MPNDTVDAVAEETQQTEEQAAEAAFESGFDVGPNEHTPATGDEPGDQATAARVSAQAEPEYARITKEEYEQLKARAALIDEIKAVQDKRFDTAFGKIGIAEKTLKDLQAQAAAGGPIEVTDEDMAAMREEYPQLAALLAKDLRTVFSKIKGGGNPDIDKIVEERLTPALQTAKAALKTEIRQEMEVEKLTEAVPDWKEVNAKAEFQDWLKAQPDGLKAKFDDSWNATFIANTYQSFKKAEEAKAKAAKDAKDAADRAAQNTNSRAARLQAAIQPRGDGGHAPGPTAADEFEEGFKKG
jgi:hypothetical protein